MDTFNLCCICLKNTTSLSNINEENTTLCLKLTQCVPEIDWSEDILICEDCKKQIEIVFAFKELCLKSFILRKKSNTAVNVIHNHNSEPESDTNNFQTCKQQDDAHIKRNNVYICYHCEKEFRNKIILARHIKSQHGLTQIQQKQKQEKTTEETVESCNSHGCSDNEEIVQPKKQKTRITKFKCEDCPEIFKTSKKLIQHAGNNHGKTVKPFQCTKCDSRFASSSNLVQHKKYHEGNRINICTYCGKGFITTSDLINHEKQHLNKREYSCEFCAKCFNTHKDLRSHKVIKHRDPSTWNYHCGLCDKRFHIKANYDSHMRRHLGDKRFMCKMCEKPFVTKDELRKHMISHTNIRDFRCSECGKEYKDKRVLDVHLVKVHAIGNAKIPVRVRKHLCSVCPKTFYDRSKLTRHMFTHTGEKPFACDLCERRFTDKSYVKHHLKVAHNVYVADLQQ